MKTTSRAVERIRASKLFGIYDYELAPSADAVNPERLIILYGDNGSGKTTILRSLFHLLAPEDNAGHKTEVSKIPFAAIEIDLTSGDRIWARRPEGRLTGSFSMGLLRRGKKEANIEFPVNVRGTIAAASAKRQREVSSFLAKLRQLDIGLYFLSDDRTVRLAGLTGREALFPREDEADEQGEVYEELDPHGVTRIRRRFRGERPHLLLHNSMRRAEMWIQSRAMQGATEGESEVNTLYGDILRRLDHPPVAHGQKGDNEILDISKRIEKLESSSKLYSQYGLLPEFAGGEIQGILAAACPDNRAVMMNVLAPYLESVEKKLGAMHKLQQQVDSLVRLVNSFFAGKRISFEIHRGFEILMDDGKVLQPNMLSSGERHLVLLFCNSLIALARPSIFIIDEPEISLNVKWQRCLLSSLIESAGDNPVQYICATHSIELLAEHDRNTVKLAPVR